jgi:hypothetical protein
MHDIWAEPGKLDKARPADEFVEDFVVQPIIREPNFSFQDSEMSSTSIFAEIITWFKRITARK